MANGRQGNQGQPDGGNAASKVAEAIKKAIGDNDKTFSTLSADVLVNQAEILGRFLATNGEEKDRLKTTQIRKFLDTVNTIKGRGAQGEDYYKNQCILLKPKLAYAAGRQSAVKPLMKVLEPCIDKVKNEKDFTHFHRFVEAIVAYHRYHGGQDN